MSAATLLTGSSLQYWECSYSYLVSTIRGLHIMLARDTKASLSPTYLPSSTFLSLSSTILMYTSISPFSNSCSEWQIPCIYIPCNCSEQLYLILTTAKILHCLYGINLSALKSFLLTTISGL